MSFYMLNELQFEWRQDFFSLYTFAGLQEIKFNVKEMDQIEYLSVKINSVFFIDKS